MNDEDFVLGYVTGYNDGVGSGSGGGKFDNIPLLKKYSFAGTDYGIGVVDVNNEMFDVAYNFPNSGVYAPDKVNFCPYPDSINRRIRLAVLKGGSIVGILLVSDYLKITKSYQFDGTAWNHNGTDTIEKIEDASIYIEKSTYSNGADTEYTLTFGYSKSTYFGDKYIRKSTHTQQPLWKRESSSPSGVSLNASQYMVGDMLGCNDISNEHFRGFLSAWADCTDLEEVF